MVREHDRERVAAGHPPAYYFVDMFVLNQHQLTKNCTSDVDKRRQLVDGLRFSLQACGTLLLCCTAGPTGIGWESPAPFSRVWCLFEIDIAVAEGVSVVVRFAPKDMVEFRQAMLKDGLNRVERVLGSLDARHASASVPSDKDMILGSIEATVGLESFNERVRQCMLTEYKRVSKAGMR